MWFALIIVGICTLLPCIVVAYLRRTLAYWSRRQIAGPKAQLFIGSFPKTTAGKCNLMEEMHEIYMQNKSKHQYVGIYLSHSPKLFVLDPALASEILIKNFQSFHDNESSQWTSPKVEKLRFCSPFVSTGEEWKEKRGELTAALTVNRLRSFHPILKSCSSKMLEYLEQHTNQPLDAKELANRFTAQFVANFIWGIEANAFEETTLSPIQSMANTMIEQSLACVRYFARTTFVPVVRKLWPVRFFPRVTDGFFSRLAEDTLEMRRNKPLDRCDVINYLLQLKDKKHLNNIQITGHTTTVLIDGYETGAILIAHCLLLLSRNERVQNKLREELSSAKKSGDLTFDTINELPYLDQCIQETLRIFPPLPGLMKLCTKPITISDSNKGTTLALKSNDVVYISSYSFHRDPDYFENPEDFYPERFDEELGGVRKYRDMGVFLPFGDGPRICPGMKLGLAEAKMAVSEIIRNFNVSCSEKTRQDNKIAASSFLLGLDGGINLIFKKL